MFSGDMVYWSDLVCPVSVLVSLTENIVVCCEKILVLILVMQLLPVPHKPLIECFDICNWHWWLVASRPGLTATTALPEVSFVFTKVFPWAGSAVRVSSVPAGNHLFVVLLLCATCCLPSMFVLPQKHASVGFAGLPPGRTSSCYWPVLRWVGHCLLSRQVSSSSRKPWCSNHWCVTSPLAKGWQHQCHLQLQMHSHLEVAIEYMYICSPSSRFWMTNTDDRLLLVWRVIYSNAAAEYWHCLHCVQMTPRQRQHHSSFTSAWHIAAFRDKQQTTTKVTLKEER